MKKYEKMSTEDLRVYAKTLKIPCPARKDRETLLKLIREKDD